MDKKNYRPRPLLSKNAFSLFELMLAITILVLVMGGVFQLVNSTLTISAEVIESRKQREEVFAFIELCRKVFRQLPSGAKISVESVPSPIGGYLHNLMIEQAPNAFAFSEKTSSGGIKTIACREAIGGKLKLVLRLEDEPDIRFNQGIAGSIEITLLNDINGIEWSLYDHSSGKWIEPGVKLRQPAKLIKLTMSAGGFTEPIECIFRLSPAL